MRAGRAHSASLRGLVSLRCDGTLVEMLEVARHLDLVDVKLVVLIQYILQAPLVLDLRDQILVALSLMSWHRLFDGRDGLRVDGPGDQTLNQLISLALVPSTFLSRLSATAFLEESKEVLMTNNSFDAWRAIDLHIGVENVEGLFILGALRHQVRVVLVSLVRLWLPQLVLAILARS